MYVCCSSHTLCAVACIQEQCQQQNIYHMRTHVGYGLSYTNNTNTFFVAAFVGDKAAGVTSSTSTTCQTWPHTYSLRTSYLHDTDTSYR
jgi:hypothetical protein